MNYFLLFILANTICASAIADDRYKKDDISGKPKEYILKPGYLMKEKEPDVNVKIYPSRRSDYGTTIINTLPNGSYIEYGTRVAPIVVERHYYNVPQAVVPIQNIPMDRPELSRSQQEHNYQLLINNLNNGVSSVIDLGYGYLMPGPNGVVYYHTKSGSMPPITVEQFFQTEEYRYLTGQR